MILDINALSRTPRVANCTERGAVWYLYAAVEDVDVVAGVAVELCVREREARDSI